MAESMQLLVIWFILAIGITLATKADTVKETADRSTSSKVGTLMVEQGTSQSTIVGNTSTEPILPKGRAVIHLPRANTSLLSQGDNSSSSSLLNAPPPFPGGLDDVSMDSYDESTTTGNCVAADGMRYINGQRWNVGCQERCTCVSGQAMCTSRCEAPLRTKTEISLVVESDPMCIIKPTDDCCGLLQCAQQRERSDELKTPPTTATSSCTFENQTHAVAETFNSGCDICVCGKEGQVTCKPRCPEPLMPESHHLCFKVPDRQDPCCNLVVCDVGEVERTGGMYDPSTMLYSEGTSVPQADARVLNATAAAISLPGGGQLPANASVETSPDGHLWSHLDAPNGIVAGLRPGRTYFIRLLVDDVPSPAVEVTLPEESEIPSNSTPGNITSEIQGDHCLYKGEKHQFGAQFHDGCMALCECSKTGVECASIDCPTNFGLDILDPNCVDWETLPRHFKPNPPHCCPDKVVCRSNGTCIFANETYPNYSDIPIEVTGCEQRCYCDNGNVTCSPMCPTVPLHPPVLPDCPVEPTLALQPGDDCCRVWMCPSNYNNQKEGQKPPIHLSNELPSFPPSTFSTESARLPTSSAGAPLSVQYLGPFAPPTDIQNESTPKAPLVITHPVLAASVPSEILPITTATSASIKTPKPTAPTYDDTSPATTILYPNKIAASFAPTADPTRRTTDPATVTPDTPKVKQHPHYIGPFVIENDDEKETSNLDFNNGPFNPKMPHFKKPHNDSYKAPPVAVAKPLPPTSATSDAEHKRRVPLQDSGPPFVYQPNQQGSIFVYEPSQYERYQPKFHLAYPAQPNYQLNIDNQGYRETNRYPNQPQAGGHQSTKNSASGSSLQPFSKEELYHLQSGFPASQQNNPIATDSQHDIYYVHSAVPTSTPNSYQDVYHILPHGSTVPIKEIIAHIRQQEQQSEQHQKSLMMQPDDYLQVHVQNHGRPKPPDKPAPVLPPVLPPYTNPISPPALHTANLPGPFGHGHEHGLGHGHGDVDDLSTETSRHPAPQQQLAQLLRNQSYTGLPPMDRNRPPFLPPGFTAGNFPGNSHEEIEVLRTEPSDTAVRLAFAVPRVLVGLHGRVEVRYTSEIENSNESTWERQILAPPGDLISTSELEFELNNLRPDTTYNIRVWVILRNLHNTPSSSIITLRTRPREDPPTTLPPQIPIDPGLTILQVNSTWAKLAWRKASPFELQFIDGVQLRYKESDGKVYAATPLIHRAVTSYTLDGLKPDTKYVAGIVFVPFADQTTELQSPQTVTFSTGIDNDPYKFDLNVEVSHIKSTSVELNWTGVPYPEDKFVNIFRAIYQSEVGKEDFSSFKLAKRDSPPRTLIQDLKPGTRYRLWMEAYLTNGRIKKSNVQDFMTKAGSGPSVGTSMQDKLEGSSIAPEPSDYYGALVAVTILAILSGIVSLTLLLILFKRCNQSKAAISTCRKSQSAYDNPSYKVEIQQETMAPVPKGWWKTPSPAVGRPSCLLTAGICTGQIKNKSMWDLSNDKGVSQTYESELTSNGCANKTQIQGPLHEDANRRS